MRTFRIDLGYTIMDIKYLENIGMIKIEKDNEFITFSDTKIEDLEWALNEIKEIRNFRKED